MRGLKLIKVREYWGISWVRGDKLFFTKLMKRLKSTYFLFEYLIRKIVPKISPLIVIRNPNELNNVEG